MKKIIALLIIGGLISPPVWAATCEGGTEITGINDDHVYCVSNIKLNWWSAFSWCRANNRKLASIDDACFPEQTSCPNLALGINKKVWTSVAAAEGTFNGHAYMISLSDGGVKKGDYHGTRRNGFNFFALCK